MHDTQADLDNRKQASEHLSSEGRKYFHFIEFDSNEKLVTEIRKDPVGLVFILITGAFIGLMVLLVTALLSAMNLDNLGFGNINAVRGLFVALGFFMLIGVAIATYIAIFLYRSNVIFVTSEKIAQVLYTSLFNRKISQLSIGDLQDVTVSQKGILAHIFHYGTLVIETAGEQQNYTFSFVPEPYQVSTMIVGAHERNLVEHGN